MAEMARTRAPYVVVCGSGQATTEEVAWAEEVGRLLAGGEPSGRRGAWKQRNVEIVDARGGHGPFDEISRQAFLFPVMRQSHGREMAACGASGQADPLGIGVDVLERVALGRVDERAIVEYLLPDFAPHQEAGVELPPVQLAAQAEREIRIGIAENFVVIRRRRRCLAVHA